MPVECGSRQPFAAQDLDPVFKGQIGRHDQAEVFIRRADDVEQQLRAEFTGRNMTQFIQDQQIDFRDLLFIYLFFMGGLTRAVHGLLLTGYSVL